MTQRLNHRGEVTLVHQLAKNRCVRRVFHFTETLAPRSQILRQQFRLALHIHNLQIIQRGLECAQFVFIELLIFLNACHAPRIFAGGFDVNHELIALHFGASRFIDAVVVDGDAANVARLQGKRIALDPVGELRGESARADLRDIDAVEAGDANVVLIDLILEAVADDHLRQSAAILVRKLHKRSRTFAACADVLRILDAVEFMLTLVAGDDGKFLEANQKRSCIFHLLASVG